VLIFDSGIGGLSILKYIKDKIKNVHYIYMLDNEAFPYGNKTELFIIERSIKIINIVKKNYPINVVVIACNTASTTALYYLRKQFKLPIIGIFPEIQKAEKVTKNNIIGLVATSTTIYSSYIQKQLNQKCIHTNIKTIATNHLALIAEKKIRGFNIPRIDLEYIFKDWMNLSIKPDTIILGCTHFLSLKKEIQRIFNQSIFFIDSKEQILSEGKDWLYQLQLNQKNQKNIFLYSKKNKTVQQLFCYLKEYNFQQIKNINVR